jgi:phage gpG-like protein
MADNQGNSVLSLKITTKELAKLTNIIEELDNKLKLKDISFRTTLTDSFTRVMSEDVRKRFQSSPSTVQGGQVYGGVEWRELSDSYLRSRPDRVAGKVLIDSGQLMNSFQVNSPQLEARFVNQFQFVFGSKVEYANKLQATWPILFVHQELSDQLAEEWIKFLNKSFEAKFNIRDN